MAAESVAVGDADVAYQVLGEGPADLLFFNGLGSNVEMKWEGPEITDFLRRLASLRRLIFLDRRGRPLSSGAYCRDQRHIIDSRGAAKDRNQLSSLQREGTA